MCGKIQTIVDGLKKTHGDKVAFANFDVSTKEGVEAVKKSNLEGHGLLAKDLDGKIVEAIEGHNYGKDRVQKVVKLLTEKKKLEKK